MREAGQIRSKWLDATTFIPSKLGSVIAETSLQGYMLLKRRAGPRLCQEGKKTK